MKIFKNNLETNEKVVNKNENVVVNSNDNNNTMDVKSIEKLKIYDNLPTFLFEFSVISFGTRPVYEKIDEFIHLTISIQNKQVRFIGEGVSYKSCKHSVIVQYFNYLKENNYFNDILLEHAINLLNKYES